MEQLTYANGKLPLGWNDDDLDHFILDGMWKMLKKSSSVNVDGDDEDNEGDVGKTVEHHDSWIAPGWMAYRLLRQREHNDFRSP